MAFLDSPAALRAFLNRPGMQTRLAHVMRSTDPPEAFNEDDPLEALLDTIITLARQHGWHGQHTYNEDGPDQGLHVILVRGEVGIVAEVRRDGEKLTPSQLRWLVAWACVGDVETYNWSPAETAAITARLSQPREEIGSPWPRRTAQQRGSTPVRKHKRTASPPSTDS